MPVDVGPSHACGFAENVGVKQIYIFPFASVLALWFRPGILSISMRSKYCSSEAFSGRLLDDFDCFNRTVKELQNKVLRDIRSEGLSNRKSFIRSWIAIRYGLFYMFRIRMTSSIVNSFNQAYEKAYQRLS